MILSFLLMAAAAPARGKPKTPGKAGGLHAVYPSTSGPLRAVRVLFRVGSVDDPPGKEGLAALTAQMVGEGGSKSRSYAEVLEALYPLAADISIQVDREATVFAGVVHKDNLDAYLALFVEQLTAPRFADDDFARHKQDALDHLQQTLRGNDDETLGKEALAVAMYPGHPYGRPVGGTVAGLDAITLGDVKAFYASHYTLDRLIFGLSVDPNEGNDPGGASRTLSETLSKALEGRKAAAPAPLPPAPAAKGRRVLIVGKGARANAISMGHAISVTRADDDFYPLLVAASYLGEHRTFNGVLMNRLRQQRGLNYGDYAYIESFVQHGGSTFVRPNIPRRQQLFSLWLRPVPPHNTGFAIRAALFETEKLVRDGIPEAGFGATRDFLMSYQALWTQDVSRQLGYALDAQIYGRDVQKELLRRLPKMKKADVDRAVKKHLDPKKLTIAIVSDKPDELARVLTGGGKTPIVYDTAGTPQAILDEDKIIEALPLDLPPDAVKVVPVEAMFEK